jgi:hypothetical protein
MLFLIGLYMCLVAIVLVWKMWHDHTTGEVEIVSVRNVAIVGFILFQCTSAAVSLFTGIFEPYVMSAPEWSALEYAGMVTLFLPVFFWSYRKGFFANALASRLPVTRVVPNDAGMLTIAVLVTLLSAGLRVGGTLVPLIGFVARDVAVGLSAVGAGMAGWVWAKRLMNPAVIAIAVAIVGVNLFIVVFQEFGRRSLVAVGAGMLVGMYFSVWRYYPLGMVVKRLMLLAIPPFLVVALFTSVRDSGEQNRSSTEHLQAILTGGSLGAGVMDLLAGQGCAAGSMWLIETHPETFPYRHMFTPFFFVIYPVPRMLWEEKPVPIGIEMASMARIQNVQRHELNIGAGIIGTAACEGGWYAVIVYAALGGLFLRFFDETIRLNPTSPFVVLAITSGLGHVLGLARGEASAFAALTVITVGGTYLTMVLLGRLLESVSRSSSRAPADDHWESDEEGQWAEGEYDESYAAAYADDQAGSEQDGYDEGMSDYGRAAPNPR